MLPALVIVTVSAALVVGAVWGIYGKLGRRIKGFLVAVAGGALIVSAVLELVDPALDVAPFAAVGGAVLAGAGAFVLLDRWVERRFGTDSGGGLLGAITLDGIPENLALGVALIGAQPLEVAALAGSILLSNLPEAAGGAREMSQGRSKRSVLVLWLATAILLSLAALAGYLFLEGVPDGALGTIQAFAAGAVIASLATTVFPEAFKDDSYGAGLATAIGLVLAVGLDRLG